MEGVKHYDGADQFELAVSVGDEFASAVDTDEREWVCE